MRNWPKQVNNSICIFKNTKNGIIAYRLSINRILSVVTVLCASLTVLVISRAGIVDMYVYSMFLSKIYNMIRE